MFDTNLYEKNIGYDQILQKNKSYRPSIVDLTMHGTTLTDGTIRQVEGYNPLISEYPRSVGYGINDSITKYTNLELNLNYPWWFYRQKIY